MTTLDQLSQDVDMLVNASMTHSDDIKALEMLITALLEEVASDQNRAAHLKAQIELELANQKVLTTVNDGLSELPSRLILALQRLVPSELQVEFPDQ